MISNNKKIESNMSAARNVDTRVSLSFDNYDKRIECDDGLYCCVICHNIIIHLLI